MEVTHGTVGERNLSGRGQDGWRWPISLGSLQSIRLHHDVQRPGDKDQRDCDADRPAWMLVAGWAEVPMREDIGFSYQPITPAPSLTGVLDVTTCLECQATIPT